MLDSDVFVHALRKPKRFPQIFTWKKALENSLKLTRIAKDVNNSWVPRWKDKREVMVGGKDVFK